MTEGTLQPTPTSSHKTVLAWELVGILLITIAGIVVMALAFSLLSYFRPRNFLFEHPEGGEYGILESYEDHDHEGGDDH